MGIDNSMPGLYIKTEQGDIDVGQHFNSFSVNPEDQSYLGVCFVHTNTAPGGGGKGDSYAVLDLPF